MSDDGKHKRTWLAPLLAAALLLLPLLYLISYCAMVKPGQLIIETPDHWENGAFVVTRPTIVDYRIRGEWPKRIYWPLEQIDRKLFPKRWEQVAAYW